MITPPCVQGVMVKVLFQVTVKVPFTVIVKVPLRVTVKVPLKVPVKVPLRVTVKMPLKVPVKVPLTVTVKIPLTVTVKVPLTVTLKVPLRVTVKVPVAITMRVPVTVPVKMSVAVPMKTPSTVRAGELTCGFIPTRTPNRAAAAPLGQCVPNPILNHQDTKNIKQNESSFSITLFVSLCLCGEIPCRIQVRDSLLTQRPAGLSISAMRTRLPVIGCLLLFAVCLIPNVVEGISIQPGRHGSESAWVAARSDELYPDTVVATIPCVGLLENVGVTLDGRLVYIAAGTSNTVTVVRTWDNAIVAAFHLDGRPTIVVPSPDGQYMFISSSRHPHTVSKVRISDNTIVGQVGLLPDPHDMTFVQKGEYLYVSIFREQENRVAYCGVPTAHWSATSLWAMIHREWSQLPTESTATCHAVTRTRYMS